MARATRGAAAAQYEGIEKGDRADLAEKEPGPLHERMAKYVKFRTGVDIDVKTVQLVRVLLTDFQASPEEKAIRDQAKAERDGQPEPAPTPAARSGRRSRGKAQDEQPAPAPAPAPAAARGRSRGKGTTAAAGASSTRGSRGRGKAQPAPEPDASQASGEQEPF